jgi:hypothetical protein
MAGEFPRWYSKTREQYQEYFKALENLGETVRKQGPLDEKTSHLVQLAAAAALLSRYNAAHEHHRVSDHLSSFELGTRSRKHGQVNLLGQPPFGVIVQPGNRKKTLAFTRRL